MHNGPDIAKKSDISYIYDGTFEGFLCCVFRSVRQREQPLSVLPAGKAQMTLFSSVFVETNPEHADIVKDAIEKKISPQSLEFINLAFLTCLDEKELHIIRYLNAGFKLGRKFDGMLAHPLVNVLSEAVKHLTGEAHLLKGFVRFSDYDGVLVAVVEPKNRALFVMADHFCDRFNAERFIIYDKVHGEALVYDGERGDVLPASEISLPPPDADELQFRALWKRFYNTIGIKERYNPVCRRGHMPMRYWGNLTEFTGDDLFLPHERGDATEVLREGRRPSLSPQGDTSP